MHHARGVRPGDDGVSNLEARGDFGDECLHRFDSERAWVAEGAGGFEPPGEIVGRRGVSAKGERVRVGGDERDENGGTGGGSTKLIVSHCVKFAAAAEKVGDIQDGFPKVQTANVGRAFGTDSRGVILENIDVIDKPIEIGRGDLERKKSLDRIGFAAEGMRDSNKRGKVGRAVYFWRADLGWNDAFGHARAQSAIEVHAP